MKVFDSVPVKIPAKNVFDLSHDVKSSYNFDKLYPFLCQPVYPGDTFNCRAEVFLRAMPLKCPVMHNVDMRLYFFFVPNRLVWNENKKRDWKTFITGGEDGTAAPDFPAFSYARVKQADEDSLFRGSLLDHLGFPTVNSGTSVTNLPGGNMKCSSLPLRAYQLVYNEYFRNQNVQNEVEFSYDAGDETVANLQKLLVIRKKCWEKDYFTSCLPWEQRGQAMTLPVSGNLQVSGNPEVTVNMGKVDGWLVEQPLKLGANSSSRSPINLDTTGQTVPAAGTSVELKGTANLSTGSVTFTGLSIGTINEFRYCLRLQQWMENNARCGSRYIEQLFAHFGVKSSDARLQRPELLGGGKVPLLFSDVEQTSFGSGSTPGQSVLGNLGGKGTLYGKTGGFKKYFEEHGILLGICCIIPRTSYSQGINRAWTAFDKTDWYFPEFAHLGEQAVLNKEIYFDPTKQVVLGKGPDDVFGYQGRFTELRYIPSSVHGEMRDGLQYWHLGRLFDATPVLNAQFVEAQTRDNIFALSGVADGDYDPFICQMHLSIKAVRPLPKYAVPTI